MADDMPKLESPFIRDTIESRYVVTPRVTPGFEWVFEDQAVLATEKLDGTNVSIVLRDGIIAEVWNRENRIPFINKGHGFIIEGIQYSFDRGYCALSDGQWFGELIGPKVQGNPYKLDHHIWIPFATYARKKLAYHSWGKYPKTFEAISAWFETDLFSLFYMGRNKGEHQPAEGVVFVQPSTGNMAKLRRDMFPWHHGDPHKSKADRTQEEKKE